MDSAELQDINSAGKKSVVFLYTSNEQSKNKIKKTFHLQQDQQ